MPAFSKSINEEGIVFDGFPILEKGKIKEQELLKKLTEKNIDLEIQSKIYMILKLNWHLIKEVF